MAYTVTIPELVTDSFSVRRAEGGNIQLHGLLITAAAATSVIEAFDGEIGVVDAAGEISVGAGGTGYQVGDQLTIPSPDVNGVDIIIEVATLTGSAVATFTLVQAGSGFTNGATIAATGGNGSGATFDIDTATDPGTSIAKLSATANLSDGLYQCILVKSGVLSVRVTGASAQGYLFHS